MKFALKLFVLVTLLVCASARGAGLTVSSMNGTSTNQFLKNPTLDGANITGLTGAIDNEIANGKQPFRYVINVKNAPYNAKGNSVADDWTAIQSAITDASLTTTGLANVYIPAGTYRLTNTLVLTSTQVSVNDTGPGIASLFGDGARRTQLVFTNTNGNGVEFRVGFSDGRHLSNFKVHDLALVGPATAANTNVFGSGLFIGYDATVPYAGDTVGWQNSVADCLIKGWKQGLCISNTVFTTARNCNLQGNLLYSVLLQHADTTRLENNNYGFPVIANGDKAAILVDGGTGVLSSGGECGNSACFVSVVSGLFKQIGGNFERNDCMLVASNFCALNFSGCRIANGNTNYQFNFYNGAANGFWAEACAIDTQNYFNQVPGPEITGELPIHHALESARTNGLFNGSPRSCPPAFFQTPRWQQDYQLANITVLNATPLTPLATSPSPFFSSDGLNINNTTGQLWLHMPSGLGNNYNDFNHEEIRFTALIQGGSGATNATLKIQTFAKRHDPAVGDFTDTSPLFQVDGITNGMCRVFTWTNNWNNSVTSDSNPRYVRLQFITTNQIYLIGLHAQTIDY